MLFFRLLMFGINQNNDCIFFLIISIFVTITCFFIHGYRNESFHLQSMWNCYLLYHYVVSIFSLFKFLFFIWPLSLRHSFIIHIIVFSLFLFVSRIYSPRERSVAPAHDSKECCRDNPARDWSIYSRLVTSALILSVIG